MNEALPVNNDFEIGGLLEGRRPEHTVYDEQNQAAYEGSAPIAESSKSDLPKLAVELDDLTSMDVVEYLQACSLDKAHLAFINEALGVVPVNPDTIRKKDWDLIALSDEEYQDFKKTLAETRQNATGFLTANGLAAHWLKFGKGDKVSYRLLIGRQAQQAIDNGYNGDWTPPPEAKRRTRSDHTNKPLGVSEAGILDSYMADVKKHPLLTKDDELRLYRIMKAGREAQTQLDLEQPTEQRAHELIETIIMGKQAKQDFISSNLRLVVSAARKYAAGRNVSILDLISEGNIGLMHAVDKFDAEKGFKFSTYALWWVRQAFQRSITEIERNIYIPLEVRDKIKTAHQVKACMERDLQRRISTQELATELGVSVREVEELENISADTISLNRTVSEDSDTELLDLVADSRDHETLDAQDRQSSISDEINQLLKHLNEDERQIIILRYGLDDGGARSQAKVTSMLGIGVRKLRRLEAQAIAHLSEIASGRSESVRDSLS